MFPLTPLSLLCAVLLCLPLAVIFTFTTPSSTTITTSSTSTNLTEAIPDVVLLPPRKTLVLEPRLIKRKTAATPPPPPPPTTPADDEDDASIIELAARVDPNPKPTKKLAFMFLTTSSLPFAPLWELFFARAAANSYNIYVHVDPRANHTADVSRGVFAHRVIPSKPTRRLSPTLTAAARSLLAHALLHDEANSMFALLSPSCIPLHSFNYTYRYLIRSRRSFMEILEKEPDAYNRWAARGAEAMVPEVQFRDFRIGSQFWVVKRKHARIIVRDRRVWSKFKLPCLNSDACYPEEHYFPTLMSMVDPRGCIPCTLTHVDWRGSHGGHPRMYHPTEVGPELITGLRKARPRYGDERSNGLNSTVTVRTKHDPFLFARKFSPGSLHQLINMASEVIFKD